MSVYRTIKRSLRSDVHHVAEHVGSPKRAAQAVAPAPSEGALTTERKASPPETLLPATERWIATLPLEARPAMISTTFPHIANELAALWRSPDEWTDYFNALLADGRRGAKGYSAEVLKELQALWVHYGALHLERSTARKTRK
ncbi:MAG TPA: hypothetical protein VEN29_15805 [Casimicrobiaceae bacterium]|nr:hypothetical protein [Casimicrobiaceae bacterium]